MTDSGNANIPTINTAWAEQQNAPPPLSPSPAVMMPPLLFSPTASSAVFTQQPLLFSPVQLAPPSQPSPSNPQACFQFSPPPSPIPGMQQMFPAQTATMQANQQQVPGSPTTSFSVQPIPGICISSPTANGNDSSFNFNSNIEPTFEPQIVSPTRPSSTACQGITGFFSPTPTQGSYFMQQRFQGLFLSPEQMKLQYAPITAPSPSQEYYAYASNNTRFNNRCPQNSGFNQSYQSPENSYQDKNYGKKTYNVLPKRRLDFSEPTNSTKRDAVLACLNQLENIFADKIDDAGFRGSNALRIRVKTWNTIKHIVPFLLKASKIVKIKKVSFPKSTKGLGKVLRGFLAYMLVEDLEERQKMQTLFNEYQKEHNKPFKKLEITER